MIVDDVVLNLNLLVKLLKDRGYRVRPFPRGKLALAAAKNDPPHLILLDINMPEMNGYEVCEQLKADATTRDVPVIFISALDDTMDKVKAFRCGGVDYITKPFQSEEVQARVATHLTIRRLQRELEHQNQHLEELVRQRTQELAEACDRLAMLDEAKTEFLNLISHELRTPMTGVFGIADMLFERDDSNPKRQRLWKAFDSSRKNLRAILDDALLLTRIDLSNLSDADSVQRSSLAEILTKARGTAEPLAESRGITLAQNPSVDCAVLGNAEHLSRAFAALLETAVKFATAPAPVDLSTTRSEGQVQIAIRTQGHAIPAEFLDNFFDVFAVTRTIFPGGNLGLGPPVAKRIFSLAGGSVTVRNEDPEGICFLVHLRVANRNEESGF
jgi:signal transduction histidine kinase